MENQEVEVSPEQVVEAICKYRDSILQIAVEQNLSFDIVFNALMQVVSTITFQYLFASQGELTEAGIAEALGRFNSQTADIAKVGFDNMRQVAEKVTLEQLDAVANRLNFS